MATFTLGTPRSAALSLPLAALVAAVELPLLLLLLMLTLLLLTSLLLPWLWPLQVAVLLQHAGLLGLSGVACCKTGLPVCKGRVAFSFSGALTMGRLLHMNAAFCDLHPRNPMPCRPCLSALGWPSR